MRTTAIGCFGVADNLTDVHGAARGARTWPNCWRENDGLRHGRRWRLLSLAWAIPARWSALVRLGLRLGRKTSIVSSRV